MRTLFALLILFLLYAGCGGPGALGQTVTIMGSFQTPPEAEPITVYRPVDGFFNVFYAAPTDEAMIRNGQFSIRLPHNKPGFFRVQSKGISKTYFYAEPNDTIRIEFVDDALSGETRAVYGGNHAPANNLLARKELFNNGKTTEGLFANILKNAGTADEAIAKIDQELKPAIAALRKLHEAGTISPGCLAAFTAETQQNALSWCGGLVSNDAGGSRGGKRTTGMNKTELYRFIGKFYEAYDPFAPRNRVATTNYANCHAKSILMADKVIGSPRPKNRQWSRYDSAFGTVVRRVAAIDFAPAGVQEYFIGNSLLTALAFNTISAVDFKQIVHAYTRAFPGSSYLPVLHQHLQENDPAQAHRVKEYKYKVYLKDSSTNALVSQDLAGADTVTSIQSLVKNYFAGQPVFIDFWASWCAPCIAEFKHEAPLHEFLAGKGIAILYVSIDKAESKAMWEKMVNKYKIAGYHYLANPAVYDQLNGWFQGIPRYMLFGADGAVLNDNLPRPSRRQELYDQINALIAGSPGVPK